MRKVVLVCGAAMFMAFLGFQKYYNKYGVTDFTIANCFEDVGDVSDKCGDAVTVFKYSTKFDDCVPVEYHGCKPSKNNFKTYEGCYETAFRACHEKLKNFRNNRVARN